MLRESVSKEDLGRETMNIVSNNIIRKIMELVCMASSKVNPYIPKSKNNILFYERTPGYMNNYELMKYLVHNGYDKKYNIFYFPDIRIECKFGTEYSKVRFSNSLLKAFILFMVSKTVFIDTGNMRIKPAKTQSVTYMDHGLPFKYAGKDRNGKGKTLDGGIPDELIMPVNYFLSSSSNFDEMYKKSYCLNQSQLLRCGRPRTDALFKKKSYLYRIGINKEDYNKIVIWMTTYRIPKNGRGINTDNMDWSSTNLPLLTDMPRLYRMNDFLMEKNYLLVLKIHQGSVFNEESIKPLSNIKLLMDRDLVAKGIQVYDVVKDFDCLITDYSSVFLDFSLTGKPMIFITDDFEEFKKLRGFFFDDPLSFMPGPKVNNYEELIKELSSIDVNEEKYEKERKRVKDFCHYYQDGCDSVRLLSLLGIKN